MTKKTSARQTNSRAKIQKCRASGMKWREIGKLYPGVALGTLARFARDDGYEPADAQLRRRLGLPEQLSLVRVKALPCRKCGRVHFAKSCPDKRKPTAKRNNWKGLALLLAGLRVNGLYPARPDYAEWRAANMPTLLAMVAWAESRHAR